MVLAKKRRREILKLILVFCLLVQLALASYASAEVRESRPGLVITNSDKSSIYEDLTSVRPNPMSPYRGWDYLVAKLKLDQIEVDTVEQIYRDPKMPRFTRIPFSLAPKESHSIYSGFKTKAKIKLAERCLMDHAAHFQVAEQTFKVPRSVITSILVVETQCGRITGRQQIIHRLSRLASVRDPWNLKTNLVEQKKKDHRVTLEQVINRANYLENTFYPEILALIRISKQSKVTIFNILGSSAGAFGFSQFLPSSYLRFGVDGDQDGKVSLFNAPDAIWSTANYLAQHGWDMKLELEQNRAALWAYNKSEAYADAVIWVAKNLESTPAQSDNKPVTQVRTMRRR